MVAETSERHQHEESGDQIVRCENILFESEDMKIAREIRCVVFVEEQKASLEIELDGDEVSTHFLVFCDDIPVGACRWRATADNKFKLERFAILKSHRGRGIGQVLMEFVLRNIFSNSSGQPVIYLHAQTHAVSFYEKSRFLTCGDIFYEENIPHLKMVYQP